MEEAAIDRWIKSFISLFIKSSRTRKAYDWIRAPLDRASEALEQKTKVRFQLFSPLPEVKATLTALSMSRTGHKVELLLWLVYHRDLRHCQGEKKGLESEQDDFFSLVFPDVL